MLLFAMMAFVPLANADVTTPAITTVYIENDGVPVDDALEYSVKCFGYRWSPGPEIVKAPGTYSPVEVYSYTASCSGYGCEIQEPYYLNYRHVDYCNAYVTMNSNTYLVERYGENPVEFSKCTNQNFLDRTRRCELKLDLSNAEVNPDSILEPDVPYNDDTGVLPVPSLYNDDDMPPIPPEDVTPTPESPVSPTPTRFATVTPTLSIRPVGDVTDPLTAFVSGIACFFQQLFGQSC